MVDRKPITTDMIEDELLRKVVQLLETKARNTRETGACILVKPGSMEPICAELTADDCQSLHGEYLGNGTKCSAPS